MINKGSRTYPMWVETSDPWARTERCPLCLDSFKGGFMLGSVFMLCVWVFIDMALPKILYG
jgi:hypothetical protein